MMILASGVPSGQGLRQLGELDLAFVLSSLIGLEREWRQKSAGLRTHTLVGTGAALILIVSKYGFGDVLGPHVTLDASRVAAQIVSGIGFIGGGLIFVRGDAVRGLTTAAIVWMTTAIGMACGAGLPILALVVTGAHFVIVLLYREVALRLPKARPLDIPIRVVYEDGRGVLRDILETSTRLGFRIGHVETRRISLGDRARSAIAATLEVQGQPSADALVSDLSDLPGSSRWRASRPKLSSRGSAGKQTAVSVGCPGQRPRGVAPAREASAATGLSALRPV